MKDSDDNQKILNEIQIFKDHINTSDDNAYLKISNDFIEKYSKNLETENDYAEILSFLKKKFYVTNPKKTELKIISNLLIYDFQYIYLNGSKEDKEVICLRADFNYLYDLNKSISENKNDDQISEPQEKSEKLEIKEISENKKKLEIKETSIDKDKSGINNNFSLVKNLYKSDLTFADLVDQEARGELNNGPEGLILKGERKNLNIVNFKSQKNLKDSKNQMTSSQNMSRKRLQTTKQKFIPMYSNNQSLKNILNLKDILIKNSNYEYSIYNLLNDSEKISFYFIFSETLETIENQSGSDSNQNYIFLESSNNLFSYKIYKEENQNGVLFTHSIKVINQSYKFNHVSTGDQNVHVFLTLDDSYNQLKLLLTVRFTKTTESNFSKLFVVDLFQEFFPQEKEENMYLVFNDHFVLNVNLFKNYNFSYEDQVSIIYKVNQILSSGQSLNLYKIMLNNILSNQISYDSLIDEFYNDERTFSFVYYMLKDCMNKNPSRYLSLEHFEKNDNSEFCIYMNQYEKCLRCSQGKKLYNFKCFNFCPEGSYENIERRINLKNTTCTKCKKNCKKCTSEKCLECKQGSFLNLLEGDCSEFCPVNTILIKDKNRGNLCKSCNENCINCDSKLNCLKCKAGNYLHNGDCLNGCPSNYYTNFIKNICEKRQTQTCEKGFYINENLIREIKCEKCPSGCKDCNFDIQKKNLVCTECDLNSHKKTIVDDELICLSKCEENQIMIENKCVKCDIENCDTCYNENSDNNKNNFKCEKCKNGFYLKDGKCLTKCGEDFVAINNDNNKHYPNMCFSCPVNCSKCKLSNNSEEDNQLICEECKNGFSLINKNSCIKECPEGFTKIIKSIQMNRNNKTNKELILTNQTISECSLCTNPNSCKKCFQNDPSHCEECYEGFLNERGSCHQSCHPGFYRSHNNDKLCMECPGSCKQCTGEKTCTECKPGFYNKNGECLFDCGDGFTQDIYSGICKKCNDSRCSVCLPFDENLCLKCKPEYKLFENLCLKSCPNGHYNKNGVCLKCSKDCLDCDSNLNCKVCDFNKGKILHEKKCVNVCPLEFFHDLQSNTCKKCSNKDCLYCDKYDDNSCKISRTGAIIESRFYEKCPENFIEEKIEADISNNKLQILRCFKCTNFCNSCQYNTFNEKTKCLKCSKNFELRDEKCIDSSCPENHILLDNKCFKCPDPNSNKCDDNDTSISIDCKSGFVLNDGKCISECPEGKYYSKKFFECTNCLDNCVECSNHNKCLRCKEDFFLFENSKCLKKCPSGYSEDFFNMSCVKCPINCFDCDTDSNNCIKCKIPFLNENGRCKMRCSLGFYENKEKGICESKNFFV